MMKKRTKEQLHDIVWKDYKEEIQKESYSAMLEYTKEWTVFGGIRARDKKRIHKYKILLFLWWVFAGSIVIALLAAVLGIFYGNICPLSIRDQWHCMLIGFLIVYFFFWFIYSINYIIKMKRDIYERYKEEVYAYFFIRMSKKQEQGYEDWKMKLLQRYEDTGQQIIRDTTDHSIDHHMVELMTLIEEFQELKTQTSV